MFRKKGKKGINRAVPLLRYWTMRYVLVLLGSLLAIALLVGAWVYNTTYDQSYQLLVVKANQYADLYEQNPANFINWLKTASEIRDGQYVLQVMDETGNLHMVEKWKNSTAAAFLPERAATYPDVLKGRTVQEVIQINQQTWLRVGVPITVKNSDNKALYVSMPAQEALNRAQHLYVLLGLLVIVTALTGWLVIYFLSRKLTSPLRQVAEAAYTIAEGGYDPKLPQVKEQELQQLVVSFHNMAERLRHLEQIRTDLLAGVSHELRTPITSIRGMIQAVQSKVVTDEEADEFLQISLDEAKRLQQMVEELLSFSSLEAGATPVEKSPVNLSALIEDVIQQLSVLPQFAEVRFVLSVPSEPIWALGDAGLLRQILLNLINNSRAASQKDDPIEIALQAEEQEVWLDVVDHGSGIPEEEQPFIFERFYRGNGKQKKTRGLGLGLTLSRTIARAHGGDLLLLRSSSEGTTFRLKLPLPTDTNE